MQTIDPIRIVTPHDGHSTGTMVYSGDKKVPGITGLTIHIQPGEPLVARIEMAVSVDEVLAIPMLSLDLTKISAEAHGFKLVAIE